MENHTFKLDTQKSVKKNFLEKINSVYSIGLFLTGLTSIGGVIFTFKGIAEQHWKEMGVAGFVQTEFYYLSIICIFISLIKILIDESPFSKTLSYCMRIVSVLYLAGAVLFPRLSGYEPSGLRIFSSADFVLIDGAVLMFGAILYILSMLIEEGFKLQKELDEVL